MEEQLISFETAKLAKEKGFHIQDSLIGSNHYFYKSDGTLLCGDNFAKQLMSHAPTQSLLQKWLRETHDIYVESYHDYDPKDKGFQFYTNWGFHNPDTIKKKQSGWYDEYNNWKKYEDALEFGLQEGLKMI